MKRWEYKVLDVRDEDYDTAEDEELNKLGQEGWELVAVYLYKPPPGGFDVSRFFLKRERVDVQADG